MVVREEKDEKDLDKDLLDNHQLLPQSIPSNTQPIPPPPALSEHCARASRLSVWAAQSLNLNLLDSAVCWAALAVDSARLALQTDPVAAQSATIHATHILCQALFLKSDLARIVSLVEANGDAIMHPGCRSLLVQSLLRLGRSDDALSYLQDEVSALSIQSPSAESLSLASTVSTPAINAKANNLYLKGVIHQTKVEYETAKKCFLDALRADAFEILIHHSMLTLKEELQLLHSLPFSTHCTPADEHLIRLFYSVQLKKYGRTQDVAAHLTSLETTYGLIMNPTVLGSRAELCAMQGKLALALEKTELVCKQDPTSPHPHLLHISLLYTLSSRNTLYLLAHTLVNTQPASPVSWYAVGTYYLLIGKTPEARTAFGKAVKIDEVFGAGWVGLGHALSVEGSHDQAVHAYSVGAKCYSGVHLPTLFMGMQYIQQGKNTIGEKLILTAREICGSDAMVENEVGVLAYSRQDYKKAIVQFVRAVKLAGTEATRHEPFDVIWCNLGNSYRHLRYYKRAQKCFENSLAINPNNPTCLASLGIVQDRLGNHDAAIQSFHNALSIEPDNTLLLDLLNASLGRSFNSGFSLTRGDPIIPTSDGVGNLSWMRKFEDEQRSSGYANDDSILMPPPSQPSQPFHQPHPQQPLQPIPKPSGLLTQLAKKTNTAGRGSFMDESSGEEEEDETNVLGGGKLLFGITRREDGLFVGSSDLNESRRITFGGDDIFASSSSSSSSSTGNPFFGGAGSGSGSGSGLRFEARRNDETSPGEVGSEGAGGWRAQGVQRRLSPAVGELDRRNGVTSREGGVGSRQHESDVDSDMEIDG
ncbi:anaphase promoting complex subunit cdc16 [Rhizoclosmatium sp. JEL0117]|nr:anaphase promoting complex subunit cdc16 [Rhizoclosmatium sp. JEL0117]